MTDIEKLRSAAGSKRYGFVKRSFTMTTCDRRAGRPNGIHKLFREL
jgi:hypothetical protein